MELHPSAYLTETPFQRKLRWVRNNAGYLACYLILIAFIVFMVKWSMDKGEEAILVRRAYDHQAYMAWVKLTGRTDITLEEYLALRRDRALGQPTK
jgi:hypothetical protein